MNKRIKNRGLSGAGLLLALFLEGVCMPLSADEKTHLNKGFLLASAELKVPKVADAGVVALDAASDKPVEDLCRQISRKLASVKFNDCFSKDMQLTSGRSVTGLPILLKEFPPLEKREAKARVLLIGGIHGDEYSSISIVFNWIQTLDKYHSGLFHWHVVPLLNPDGLLVGQSQRMNSNGVDLNRNFPTPNWEEESIQRYWMGRTKSNPRRYPGPSALSEPESQWLAKEIEEFKPDAIVSVHAPYGILDFDGPKSAPNRLGYLHLNVLGTYPGSLGNYAGIQKDIPVITIELPFAGILPTDAQMSEIWVDLVGWLKRNADTPGVTRSAEAQSQTDPS